MIVGAEQDVGFAQEFSLSQKSFLSTDASPGHLNIVSGSLQFSFVSFNCNVLVSHLCLLLWLCYVSSKPPSFFNNRSEP